MVPKYLDPWKYDKYGKLRGDKSEAFFKTVFDEAKIYKTEDSFILAAYVTDYQGIVRSFKPENPMSAGLCAIPIYGQDYEIRSKDKDGNWNSETIKPSKFELALFSYLSDKENSLWDTNTTYKGEFTHIPNAMCASITGTALTDLVVNNFQLEATTNTGKLPDYEIKKSFQRKGNGGDSRGLTPEEKLAFIKKTLEEDVNSIIHKQGQTLSILTDQIIKEHSDNPNFIEIYFDMLIACVR